MTPTVNIRAIVKPAQAVLLTYITPKARTFSHFKLIMGKLTFIAPRGNIKVLALPQFKPLRIQQLIPHGKCLRFRRLRGGDRQALL